MFLPDWLYLIVALSLVLSWLFVIYEIWSVHRITNILLKTDVDLKETPKVSIYCPCKK